MARRLKLGIKAALDFLDEPYAKGIVIVYRDVPALPGPELLFSSVSRLHGNTLKVLVHKSKWFGPI
jgi:hypothetical protein